MDEWLHDYHLRPPSATSEEARLDELRGLIERMGEINLTAIEEYDELQKRYEYLTAQKTDLERARAAREGDRADQPRSASCSARPSTR